MSENNHSTYYNRKFDPDKHLQVGGQEEIEEVMVRAPGVLSQRFEGQTEN